MWNGSVSYHYEVQQHITLNPAGDQWNKEMFNKKLYLSHWGDSYLIVSHATPTVATIGI